MNNQESKSLGRYVAWGLLGLIILVGASIARSVIFFVSRPSGTFHPFFPFPFFPFHFGFIGILLLFIYSGLQGGMEEAVVPPTWSIAIRENTKRKC